MIFVVFGGLIVAIVLALIVLAFLGIPLAPYNIGKTRAASERGFDELLVPDYLIAPGITINEDGAFTTGWRLLGPDAVSNSEGAIRRLVGDFNAALSCTREGWMYEFQRVRLPVAIDDNEAFLPTATQRVLREQRVLECWTDEVRLLVTYLPPDDIALGAVRLLVHEPEDVTADQKAGRAVSILLRRARYASPSHAASLTRSASIHALRTSGMFRFIHTISSV